MYLQLSDVCGINTDHVESWRIVNGNLTITFAGGESAGDWELCAAEAALFLRFIGFGYCTSTERGSKANALGAGRQIHDDSVPS